MRFLTADVVFPVHSDPIYGGILVLGDDGSILDLLKPDSLDRSTNDVESYPGFLCPGFINSHCHLELSWALGLIAQGGGLDAFIRELELKKRNRNLDQELEAIANAGDAMHATGTVAVGDISNTRITALYKQHSPILFHTFPEVFASDPQKAMRAFENGLDVLSAFTSLERNNRASLSPHATYSVSMELLDLIRQQRVENPGGMISIHHQETEDENTYFLSGTGPISERISTFNPGIQAFRPGGNRPLKSIAPGLGSESHLLLVHNTYSNSEDIEFAEQYFRLVSWCLCPNSNLYIENKFPPLELLYNHGVKILLGTDSLASNSSLSLLEEMKTIGFRFPGITLNEILKWATKNAADSFGFESLGTFSTGKRPGVVWIDQVDVEGMRLLPNSVSRLLIPAGL
jgi:aminodeoxyfutalosine deaminase